MKLCSQSARCSGEVIKFTILAKVSCLIITCTQFDVQESKRSPPPPMQFHSERAIYAEAFLHLMTMHTVCWCPKVQKIFKDSIFFFKSFRHIPQPPGTTKFKNFVPLMVPNPTDANAKFGKNWQGDIWEVEKTW